MRKAILIPANPRRKFRGGQPEGRIDAHEAILQREGAVIWRLIPPSAWEARNFPHQGIKNGYLYDVSARSITHSCTIESITPMLDVSFEDARRLVVGGFKDRDHFDELAPEFYAIKIIEIFPLRPALTLWDFNKFADGKPVKLVRNYCIVQDPKSSGIV